MKIVFKIEVDQGQVRTIKLPNSLYVPGLPCPLLVPWHWSEQARDRTPHSDETHAFFQDKSCKFYWDQKKHCKKFRYHDSTRTQTFFTEPGSKTYHAFNAIFEANDTSIPYRHILQLNKSAFASHNQETFDPTEFVAEEDLN